MCIRFLKILKNIFFWKLSTVIIGILLITGYIILFNDVKNNNINLILLKIYTPIILLILPLVSMALIARKLINFKKYLATIVPSINLAIIILFENVYAKISFTDNWWNYFNGRLYRFIDYIAMIAIPVLFLIIISFRKKTDKIEDKMGVNIQERKINIKEFILKGYSIGVGIIAGFWVGSIFGMIAAAFILGIILGHDISGEESLGVALTGFIFGAPAGMIAGAMLSYHKRKSRAWILLFLAITLIIASFYLLPILISPLGEVMRLFN